jgi:hypothetical protein
VGDGLWRLGLVVAVQTYSVFVPRVRLSYSFVDFWVLGQLTLSVMSLVISPQRVVRGWEWALLVWGAIRIFEIVVYQVEVLLFGEYRALKSGRKYAVRGYRRLVILAVHNYAEVLVRFAFAYRNFSGSFSSTKIQLDSLTGSLYFSIVTVSTIGFGVITPIDSRGAWIVMCQIAVGLFMTLMLLARFVGLLGRPKTLDPYEVAPE